MFKIKTVPAIIIIISAAAAFFAATVFGAERTIYTWTDERGNLHMTDEPPPSSAKIREVETYRDKTPEEIESLEQLQTDIEQHRYQIGGEPQKSSAGHHVAGDDREVHRDDHRGAADDVHYKGREEHVDR